MKFFKHRKDSFFLDVIKLSTGSTLAQAIGLLSAPIVTRVYSPEAFGEEAFFLSVTAIIGVFICFGYETAIVLPKKTNSALNILVLTFFINCIFTLLLILLLPILNYLLIHLSSIKDVKRYFNFIPLYAFINGILLTLTFLNIRFKNYGTLALSRTAGSFSIQAFKIGFGALGNASGGYLIISNIIGNSISAIMLVKSFFSLQFKDLKTAVSLVNLKEHLVIYKKFPMFSMWSSFINAVSYQIPIIVIAYFFAPNNVGLYSLCSTVLNQPAKIVGLSINRVFLQKSATLSQNRMNLGKETFKLYENMFKYTHLNFFLLAIIGEDLFSLVFGEQWRTAGIYAQILSIFIMIKFLNSPISNIFIVLNMQEKSLYFNSLITLTGIAALFIGAITGSIYFSLAIYSFAGIFAHSILIIVAFKLIQIDIKSFILTICRHLIVSVPIVSFMLYLKYGAEFAAVTLVLTGIVCSIIYHSILVLSYGYKQKK
jgi:O-antigen/teichoic acid export membrane protein